MIQRTGEASSGFATTTHTANPSFKQTGEIDSIPALRYVQNRLPRDKLMHCTENILYPHPVTKERS